MAVELSDKINLWLWVVKQLKFIYSEKATEFCEISTVDLTGTTVEISQNSVAFFNPKSDLL